MGENQELLKIVNTYAPNNEAEKQLLQKTNLYIGEA